MYFPQHRSKIDLFSAKRENKMPWSCLALAMELVCWQKRLKKQANGWKVFRGLALGRIIWRVFLFPLVRKKQTGWLTKHIRTSFAKGLQNETALRFYKIVPWNLGASCSGNIKKMQSPQTSYCSFKLSFTNTDNLDLNTTMIVIKWKPQDT